MAPALPEAAAHLQLLHLARQLDVPRFLARAPADARAAAAERLAPLQAQLSTAVRAVQRYVHAVAYHWVRVSDMFSKLSFAVP